MSSQPLAKTDISCTTLSAIADAIRDPRFTTADYAEATRFLYNIAIQGTGTSRAAAQLLLSSYNGSNWQVDITDLAMFNFDQQQIALQFIECRITLPEEPHQLLDHGVEKFMALQQQWWRLHSENRWRSDCGECYGTGQVFVNEEDENDETTETCIACEGTGLYPPGRKFPC